jgi:hypothetical protein
MKQMKNTTEASIDPKEYFWSTTMLLNNTTNNYMEKTRARTNTSTTSRSIILVYEKYTW